MPARFLLATRSASAYVATDAAKLATEGCSWNNPRPQVAEGRVLKENGRALAG